MGWAGLRRGFRGIQPSAPVLDVGLAVVFLAVMVTERINAAPRIGVPMPVAVALSVVIAAALAARRWAPLTAYVVGSLALSVEAMFVLPSPVTPYANLIGVYSLGRYATRGRARLGPVLVPVGLAAYV